MAPPPGLKSKIVSRSGVCKKGLLVLSKKQKSEYWHEPKSVREMGWPVRDYTMPCSLPTHKKVAVAAHKAFELCDYYLEMIEDGGIRDPCINVLYKVISKDAPKFWSTEMMGMASFRKVYPHKRLVQIIANSLTQNYDTSGTGRVDFKFQVMWREPAGCCTRADVPPQLLKKNCVFKVYNEDGRCGQRCIAMFFLLQKTRKDMHRYYTVPKRAA